MAGTRDEPGRRTRGIAFRLAMVGTLAAITLGIFFSGIQVFLDFGRQREALDRQIENILAAAASPAASAVYYVDRDLAGEVAGSLLINEFVSRAEIFDEFDGVIGAAARPDVDDLVSGLEQMVAGERQVVLELKSQQAGAEPLGRIEITVNDAVAYAGFLDRALVVFLTGIARNVAIALILVLAFHFVITRPLLALIGAFRAVDPNRPTRDSIAVPAGQEGNELGDLAEAGNQLIAKIAVHMEQAKSAEAQLEEQVEATQAALQEAEHLSEVKTRFLASMSHELRTPLNAIIGFSEMMKNGYPGPDQPDKIRTYCADIHLSATQLLILVSKILDLSEIDTGRRALDLEAISLREAVDEGVALLSQDIAAKQLDLRVEFPSDSLRVLADRSALGRILQNLLSNAVRFSDNGSQVTVSASAVTDQVRLCVEDCGPGIAPEEIRQVTSKFYRSDADPYTSNLGWGLGLAICKLSVEQHGGTLAIDSELGRGTRILVTLPEVPEEGSAEPAY